MRVSLFETAVSNVVRVNNMKRIFFGLICAAIFVACTPSPAGAISASSVKEYVSEKAGTHIQVFVESQKDTDGDLQNIQRELTVAFLLPDSAAVSEVVLPNGLMLKRGIRSSSITAFVVLAKDGQSWKTVKVELAKIAK